MHHICDLFQERWQPFITFGETALSKIVTGRALFSLVLWNSDNKNKMCTPWLLDSPPLDSTYFVKVVWEAVICSPDGLCEPIPAPPPKDS